MRSVQFLIFFSIVLLIYSLVNYYIFIRGMQALPAGMGFKKWYPWIFLFLSASYIISRFMERVWISPVSNVFTFVGSFWLALMVYLLMAVLVVDLLRLVLYFLPQPAILANNYVDFKKYLFMAVVGITGIVVLAGHINALNPRIKRIDIHIDKKAGQMKTLHIAAASDIHMGTLVGARRTAKLVRMLNERNADLILLAGDIVDEDLAPVIHNDLGQSLLKLKATLGVFAITGNHEYIGGAEAAVKYLEEHGIQMLRDTSVKINESFYLAGRNDRDSKRFSAKERKGLDKILEGVDLSFPVIMMDHQPFNLQQVADAGIDFQLSGHTHHGQLWPFGYITKAIYELSWGYKQKGNSHFYVSSGYGGWGPPVRTGNRPEILDIYITFN
jgi:predicted MPP superfamily phosphohydrolase